MTILYLEGPNVLQLGDDLIFGPLPIFGSSWDLLKHSARVFHLIRDMPPRSDISLALHTSEVGI